MTDAGRRKSRAGRRSRIATAWRAVAIGATVLLLAACVPIGVRVQNMYAVSR